MADLALLVNRKADAVASVMNGPLEIGGPRDNSEA